MTESAVPTHTFTIPSLQTDIDLPCRIYHPSRAQPTPSCAIVAHPYAPMGGSYDDPIVLTLVDELTQQGYIVGTFNFRGGPGSKASTSWTAKAEIQDYISVIHLLINYTNNLHALRPATAHPPTAEGLSLLLSGYSYGALVTSLLPTLSSFFPPPASQSSPTSLVSRIRQEALRLACQATQSFNPEDGQGDEVFPLPKISHTSYLLVSPILGPIASLATFFSASSAKVAGEEKLVAKGAGTLVVFGDEDSFTSAQKVGIWCEEMVRQKDKNGTNETQMVKERFEWREIAGAGHFWRERGVETEMRRTVREWIQKRSK